MIFLSKIDMKGHILCKVHKMQYNHLNTLNIIGLDCQILLLCCNSKGMKSRLNDRSTGKNMIGIMKLMVQNMSSNLNHRADKMRNMYY